MPKILVTGATGTFGGLLAQLLRRRGEQVRVMVRDPARFTLDGFEIAVGDFAEIDRIDDALSGIERVFLASFDTGDFVTLQKNVISAAKRQGVQHIARISTMFLEEPRFAHFMNVSINGERQLEASGIEFTHLRPSWVLQNFLPTSAATPVRDNQIRLPAGEGRVGFVDARDVASVAATVLTEPGHEGKTYELTGPAARTHGELAAALSQATGRDIVYQDISPKDYADSLVQSGWPSKSVETMTMLFEHTRNGDAAILTEDVERVTGTGPLGIHNFAHDHAHLF
jgi:uncharacterized protein YbjT (DUF2867 family)